MRKLVLILVVFQILTVPLDASFLSDAAANMRPGSCLEIAMTNSTQRLKILRDWKPSYLCTIIRGSIIIIKGTNDA